MEGGRWERGEEGGREEEGGRKEERERKGQRNRGMEKKGRKVDTISTFRK